MHPRYFLSEKACRGILGRAERRGKELPPMLNYTLIHQAEHNEEVIQKAQRRWDQRNTPVMAAGFNGKAGSKAGSVSYQEEVSPTLRAQQFSHVVIAFRIRSFGNYIEDDKSSTILSSLDITTGDLIVGMDQEGLAYTLNTVDRNAVSITQRIPKGIRMYVRRLTPLECERLQGYPDGWTDIPDYVTNGRTRKASDASRYKALGNSIALPPWRWVLKRLSQYLGHSATLGSLFDGIGGFPLIWEEIHGPGSARWASEIELFPIAVTKFNFCKE